MPWRFPWYRENEREEKQLVLGTTEELGQFLIFGSGGHAATPSAAISLYERSSAVSIPINMVADAFSVLDPVLVVDDKIIKQHELLDLISQPNPFSDQELFLETLAKDYLITGETELVALGNRNRPPLELQPISPKNVTVVEGTNGTARSFHVAGNTLAGEYRAERAGRFMRYFDSNLRELKQIRSYSTRNNSLLRGQSRLVAAAKEARQHILGTEHNVSLLEKGGRVSLVFHFDADMNQDDYELTKARVLEQYSGASKAGQIGVTSGGKLEIKELSKAGKDMDYPNLNKLASKACALVYHVPLPLISDERQTMNNYKEGKLALYDDAVIPLSRRIFGGLSFLFPRFGLDPARTRIGFDPDQVTAIVSRRNDEIKKRASIGVETDNELRALLSREPIEGGEVLRKPSNLIPVGTDTFVEDEDPAILENEDDV